MTSYQTTEGVVEAEIVVKKSRFIAHLSHVETEEEALGFLQEIRTEHAQARHNVYAYLLRSGRARYSDDGEPAQTSGLPTYETLDHAGLVDVVCVTTRYFGGTLLGTGGLVRAYTEACTQAIKRAHVVRVARCVDLSLRLGYDLYQAVVRLASEEHLAVIQTDFTDEVAVRLRTLEEDVECVRQKLVEVTRGRCEISASAPFDGVI